MTSARGLMLAVENRVQAMAKIRKLDLQI